MTDVPQIKLRIKYRLLDRRESGEFETLVTRARHRAMETDTKWLDEYARKTVARRYGTWPQFVAVESIEVI